MVFNKEVLFLACNQHKTSDVVFIINAVNASLTSRLEETGKKSNNNSAASQPLVTTINTYQKISDIFIRSQ